MPDSGSACSRAGRQLAQPTDYGSLIKLCARVRRHRQQPRVIVARQCLLAEVVEADRKIVDMIGPVGFKPIGLEIGLLSLDPAPFGGIKIAQLKMQCGRIRILGQ